MGGGGPGGGGGSPLFASHLVCDPDRERAEVGVSIAPADIALRAAGGPIWMFDAEVPGLMGSGV